MARSLERTNNDLIALAVNSTRSDFVFPPPPLKSDANCVPVEKLSRGAWRYSDRLPTFLWAYELARPSHRFARGVSEPVPAASVKYFPLRTTCCNAGKTCNELAA